MLGQRVADLVGDIDELKVAVREYHHRLRGVESAVALLVDTQKDARRAEQAQYRRIIVWIQFLTLTVAVGALALSVTLALTHH